MEVRGSRSSLNSRARRMGLSFPLQQSGKEQHSPKSRWPELGSSIQHSKIWPDSNALNRLSIQSGPVFKGAAEAKEIPIGESRVLLRLLFNASDAMGM